jgi:hypothetical protein
MKFDVIVGNPPYQLDTGGFGRQAKPIYQLFVQQAKKLKPRFLTMIIPSRWFAGGMGLDEFRESMLADNQLRSIDDYLCASDAFPGVGLKGGVCYFLWDRDNPGLCRVTTHFKDRPVSTVSRPLLEKGIDVFIRFNEGLSILTKNKAESVLSYLACRLTRFLILLHKPSQDTTRKVYSFVPMQKWNRQWTDKDLYAKYDLSPSEIAFIESIVRPMELDNE